MIDEHFARFGSLRVIDDDVDFPVSFHRFGDDVFDGGFVRAVRGDGENAGAVSFQLLFGFEESGLRSACDDELCARFGVCGGNAESDSPAAARDDNDLVFDVHAEPPIDI